MIFHMMSAHLPKVTFEQKIEGEGGSHTHVREGHPGSKEQIVQRA